MPSSKPSSNASRAPTAIRPPGREIESRVEFYPWFYYVEGLLYVEHGHQFDASCNYAHQLAPVCPEDPGRICWSISDWLLRTVVRPTPGLGAEGHDQATLVRYLRLVWGLGVSGALRLGWRTWRALSRAGHWGHHISGQARAIGAENERRMAELAGRMRVGLEKMRELAAMWPRPLGRRISALLRMLFLDRIALCFGAAVVIAVLAAVGTRASYFLPTVFTLVAGTALYIPWSQRRRASDLDSSAAMRRAARRIARMLPTRFVVMGHTHEPMVEGLGEGATYVNLGCWGVEDIEGEGDTPLPADVPRTHLVLRWIGGELRAEFCRWTALGPEPACTLPE